MASKKVPETPDVPPERIEPNTANSVVLDLDAEERTDAKPPFTFRHRGRRWMLSDARDLDWQKLLIAGGNPVLFMRLVLPADDVDAFFAAGMPSWKLQVLMERYYQHYGIPNPGRAGMAGA